MNYYERHIGDYLKDTAHLSLLEHGVYTRLLDVYYSREMSIPEAQAARLIGARSADELEALENVLREFFEPIKGAWHHNRCELEVARFKETEPEREAKRENERERQRRTRERRRELFDRLRDAGIVPAFDAPMSELQTLINRVTSQPVTPPVTRDATATHLPSPNPIKEREARASRLPSTWGLPEDWRAEAAAERPDLDLDLTAKKFADHWAAKPGKDGRKLDWRATWRNWVRDERAPIRGSPMLAAVTVPSSEWERTQQRLRDDAEHKRQADADRAKRLGVQA